MPFLSCDQRGGENLGAGEFCGRSALCIVEKDSTPRGNSTGFLFFRLLFFLSPSALKPPAVTLADFKEITLFPAVSHRFFITARWRSGKESAC